MDIRKFFTDYDDSVTGTSTLDPLGLRVIWQGLGQQIFDNMISSIANDVRNYTLSLFLHSVVREVSDNSVFNSQQQKDYWGTPSSLNFKSRLFIFLENLYIRSFVLHKETNQTEVSTTGVLGIRKGVELSAKPEEFKKRMRLAKQGSEILTNQLSLGVLGRYKTPLSRMGFLDGNLSYHASDTWAGFESLLEQNPKLHKLQKELVTLVDELLRTGTKEPQYEWDGSANTTWLMTLFGECFKDPATVGKYAADFWLQLTHLNQGVAGFVYRNLQNESPRQAYLMAYQQIQEEAQPDADINKLGVIIDTEPFLAEMDLLFRTLCAGGITSLQDAVIHMETLGRSPQSFMESADRIPMEMVPSGSARNRLENLKRVVANKSDWDSLIHALHSYHTKIMEDRGLSPWFYITQDDRLQRHVGLYQRPTPKETAEPGLYWHHNYYYYDLKNMAYGLEGGSR